MTKHPNYEFIVAFAEGKEVEYKSKGLDGAWDVWERVNNIGLFSDITSYEFRLKPEKKKTIGYRRYVWNSDTMGKMVDCCWEEAGQSVNCVSAMSCFIKWIDLDWQYEEIEE